MKIKISLLIIAIFFFAELHAQLFINKARIEYEVKSNIKKTMGNDMFDEMLKENLPTFKTGYYTFSFADNKSIYKFDHWDEKEKIPAFFKRSDEENIWYADYNTGKLNMQKNMSGSNLEVEDSVRDLQWKLTNENRIIAGFNCRKAVAIIFDSVYVFAFYTDEIMISGGPCSINGLPGMIMGVSIPRLYTSWIATKVMLDGVDVSAIKPLTGKKQFTMKTLEAFLKERTKDWYSDDPDNAAEIQQQKARFFWTTLL
jgi:GLPGLI family protein